MLLTSPAFQNQETIPAEYTCDGNGSNPPLMIGDVPEEAKSLVLIVDDPDAPMGLFTHWVVWNIAPDTKELPEDTLPMDVREGTNSSGEIGWSAPCPPNGVHHYRFQLFALNSMLDVKEGADRNTVESTMEDAVIARAELVGEYERPMQQPA